MNRLRCLLVVALAAWVPARADVATDALTQYDALAGKKAYATDPTGAATAATGGHASDTAAAVAAFQACESRRRALAATAPCEVARVNDTPITTGAAIRARLPEPPYPLFLWRFERDASTVWLAGSMHIMKPTLHPLAAQYEQAFERAERLVVEVNTLAVAPAKVQEIVRNHGVLEEGRTLASVLPAPVMARLEAHLNAQAVPLTAVASLKPAMLATQLTVDRLAALGYFPSFGMDVSFIARAGTRPVLELETIEDQLALLLSPALDVQIDMLAQTLEQISTIEPLLSDLVVAWLSGDDAALRRLFDEQSPKTEAYAAFNRRLLDDRNARMAERIERYLDEGGKYFVLVGAAHLAGPGSVIEVLERRGTRGTRIDSDDEI
jgi:hypothetical protein